MPPPKKTTLRAVPDPDAPKSPPRKRAPAKKSAAKKPATPRKKSVTQAAANGTELELLQAVREVIAKKVQHPNTPARDLAALTKRLMDITREINALLEAEEQEAKERAEVPDEAFDSDAI